MVSSHALAAVPQSGPKHEVITDVPFLPEARRRQMRLPNDTFLPGAMDIYVPGGLADDELRPAVVIIHGGGWAHRRRRTAVFIHAATRLAESGYVAAVIDYTLAPMEARGVTYLRNMTSCFPQCLHDVKSAVRFLRRNADKYHVDPDRIVTMGSSAGGHLAALAAVTQRDKRFEPARDGLGDVSSAVQACVSYYGPHDWSRWGGRRGKDTREELAEGKLASTINHIDKTDPPMLVFHGDRDRTVPYAQSQRLVARLKAAGVAHQFVTFEGKDHGMFYVPHRSGVDDHAIVVRFLQQHLDRQADEPATQ
jgi:acetyl esterase/lipase